MPQALEKTIRIPRSFGDVEVRSGTAKEEERTVEVVWSTGAAVKRYSWDEGYYMEELSMEPKHIRMARFKTGMSLLDSHDNWTMAARLGTIVPGSVRVENGKGYATVKFSRSEMAETIFRDLLDGHPIQISVGYKVHRYEKTEGSEKTLPTFRATDWEPMELSVVPIPADAGSFSRSEQSPPDDKSYEVVMVRHDENTNAADAASIKETPMNKREAAKTLKGKELDALALGAGLARNANETDDQLSARLLAHYDAEDKQRADAEAAQKRADEEAAKRAAEEEAAKRTAAATTTTNPSTTAPAAGLTAEQVAEQLRSATAAEKKRAKDIRDLARNAGFTEDEDFVRTAIEGETTVDAFRSAMLDKLIEKEQKSPTFPHAETRGMRDSQETTRKLIANAMMHRHGLTDKLEDGANQYREMSLVDVARDLLVARGESGRGSNVDILRRSLHSTSDFPIILGDITRQTMMSAYMLEQEQNTFQLIASRNVMPDLREVKVLEMGNGPELEELTEKGEYKRGTIKESQEGFTMSHYGKVIGLTERMIINDQLGAFAQVIANWGRVVARLEGNIVWGKIINNDKLKSDNKALFHADHGNLAGSGTALDETNLIAARVAFRKQKDIDGQQISLAPTYLFVGTDLEVPAQKLITGVTVPNTTAQVVPQAIRSLQPVYESRIDALPNKPWFLFATPQATLGRGLQYSYLSGYESPRTMERWGFDYDGVEYRLDHYFGAGLTDYRFAYKNAGV